MTPELQADLQALADKYQVQIVGAVKPVPIGVGFEVNPTTNA